MHETPVITSIIDYVIEHPGEYVYELLRKIKRLGFTYREVRESLLTLQWERVIIIDRHTSRVYFNRNQRKVYRGLT